LKKTDCFSVSSSRQQFDRLEAVAERADLLLGLLNVAYNDQQIDEISRQLENCALTLHILKSELLAEFGKQGSGE
jgi:hypothetical protein